MFMASSWTGSWPLGVILTLRRDVFICGDTDVMVPCTMVPFFSSIVTVSLAHFIKNLTSFILAACEESELLQFEFVWPRGGWMASESDKYLRLEVG